MKTGNVKLFKSKSKLYHVINFRVYGYSETTLATLFNCHWTSLDYLFKKYHIPSPVEIYSLERIIAQNIPKEEPHWKLINGVKYNLGRDYKDYVLKTYPNS